MKLDISIIKCSGCNAWSKYLSEIQKHCSTSVKCNGHTPITKTFEFEFPENDPPKYPVTRRKTGPTPPDMDEILFGRAPAFTADESDESFARRIDHLFDTEGLLEKCITYGSIEQRIGNLFSVLYGKFAPEKLQSIIMYRGKVYAIADAYASGAVSFDEFPSIYRYFKDSDFFQNFMMRVLDICNLLYERREDLANHVNHIYRFLNINTNRPLSIIDALEKNDEYIKHRTKHPDTVNGAKQLTKILTKAFTMTTINNTPQLPSNT